MSPHSVYENSIDFICNDCADKDERIAFLESELGWRKDAQRQQRLKEAFDLRPKERAMLEMLYGAKGAPVPRWRLENATLEPGDEEERLYSDNVVSVYIVKLRKKLGPHSIDTLWGKGYSLTVRGMDAVARALAKGDS